MLFSELFCQRERWLKPAWAKVCDCVTMRWPGRVWDCRNTKLSLFVLSWSGFTLRTRSLKAVLRDLTLCVTILRLLMLLFGCVFRCVFCLWLVCYNWFVYLAFVYNLMYLINLTTWCSSDRASYLLSYLFNNNTIKRAAVCASRCFLNQQEPISKLLPSGFQNVGSPQRNTMSRRDGPGLRAAAACA